MGAWAFRVDVKVYSEKTKTNKTHEKPNLLGKLKPGGLPARTHIHLKLWASHHSVCNNVRRHFWTVGGFHSGFKLKEKGRPNSAVAGLHIQIGKWWNVLQNILNAHSLGFSWFTPWFIYLKSAKPLWYFRAGILRRNTVNKWRNKDFRTLPAEQNR